MLIAVVTEYPRKMQAPSHLNPDMLAAANINPCSFLATDYLNHFNEVVMLMEMVPDMPDMVEEVLAWEPCDYARHFDQSVFAAKSLAIEAYHEAPRQTRFAFDAVIADLDKQIVDIQIMLSGVDASSPIDPALADRLMMAIVNELRPAIDKASGIINAVDGAFPCAANDEGDEAKARPQDAIDELFN